MGEEDEESWGEEISVARMSYTNIYKNLSENKLKTNRSKQRIKVSSFVSAHKNLPSHTQRRASPSAGE